MQIRTHLIVAMLVAAAPAFAQSAANRDVTVGVFAGGTFPAGTWAPRVYDPGAQAGALIEYKTPIRWLALRADGRYGRMGNGTQQVTDASGRPLGEVSGSTSVVAASANIVARIPGLRSTLQPYGLAGVGSFWLQTRASLSGPSGNESFGQGPTLRANGANVGIGVEAPLKRTRLFAEIRYERMGSQTRFVPMSFGVKLR